jgi:hypothetical protein
MGKGNEAEEFAMHRLTIFALGAAATAGTAYSLPAADAPSAKSGDQRDRVICRRFLRTGSLVDGYRTCKTRAEWDREHENLQRLSVSDSCRNSGQGGAGCNQ